MKKLFPLLALIVAACSGGGGNDNDGSSARDMAVIAARTPDFSAGAVSLVDVEAPYAAQNNLAARGSDISVRSGGDHYFLIEAFAVDQISRYEAATPGTATWTFSTQDSGDAASSNPYDIVIASPTKAYLLRYGSSKMWIVNPSATTEGAFKIGEIDLSGYDTADGIPEMSAGIIRGGKLYVTLQRLEAFSAVKSGYVAVFDIATDTEITTGNPAAASKGIRLPVRNPSRIEATPDGDLLVLGTGGYDSVTFDPLFNGGIVRIDTDTYAVTVVQGDGNVATHPFGQLVDFAVADDERAYFVGSTGFFGSQTLYRFDPAGGSAPVAVDGFDEELLGTLAVAPTGELFVGLNDDAAPGVAILGFSAGAETVLSPRVDTALTPINIDFVTAETDAP